jgi:hypothetical protein
MFPAKQYRAKAAESAESGKQSNDPGESAWKKASPNWRRTKIS